MAAPTNISAATATPLGDLPATATQRVDDAGTTYSVWYSFVAPENCVSVNCFGFGDLVTYRPDTSLWEGDPNSPDMVPTGFGDNLAILAPVVAGDTYFVKCNTNGGNPSPANLTLNVQAVPRETVPAGSLAVNDDNDGFPLVFYDVTTGDALRYINPFPASDFCDVLPSGYILALNFDTDTWGLYDPQINLITNPAIGTGYTRVSSNQDDLFYVANATTGAIKTVNVAGTVSAVIATVTGGLWTMAPAIDDSILYYVATSGTNQAVKRWDLNTDMALSNLAAGIVNYATPKAGILVLTDTSIVVAYAKTTVVKDIKTLQYSSAGATLHTLTYGSEATTATLHQIQHAVNDTTEFWSWLFLNNADATMEYRKIKISDGTTQASITAPDYTGGVYHGQVVVDPERFGNSTSCQFFIQRQALMLVTTETLPIRRQRRFLLPSSPDKKNMQIPVIELLMRTGIGLTEGPPDAPVQGSDPQVMIRLSKDGGKTWGNERWLSAGKIGQYVRRVRLLRATGNYRNAVLEVSVSDPVDWQFLAALAPNGIIEGSS